MHPLSTQTVSAACPACRGPMYRNDQDSLTCPTCGAEWISAAQLEERSQFEAERWHWAFQLIRMTEKACPTCVSTHLQEFRLEDILLGRCPACAGILLPKADLGRVFNELARVRREATAAAMVLSGIVLVIVLLFAFAVLF